MRDIDGVSVGDKRVKFDRNGSVMVHDAGLARDIRALHDYAHGEESSSVVVCEVDDERPSHLADVGHPHHRTHHYTFTVPDLPWKRRKTRQRKGSRHAN